MVFPIFGQNGKITVNKSNKLDSIIKLKKELNSKIQNLRIQIYNGDRENAELVMKEYIEIFKDTSANIIYETPNYKIWVGNFYTSNERGVYKSSDGGVTWENILYLNESTGCAWDQSLICHFSKKNPRNTKISHVSLRS